MAFILLDPSLTLPAIAEPGTGVSMTNGPEGLTLTITGEAREALGGCAQAHAVVCVDEDLDVIRLICHVDGAFPVINTGGRRTSRRASSKVLIGRSIRLSHPFAQFDCLWWPVKSMCAIDVEIPREVYRVELPEGVTRGAPAPAGNH